MTKLMVAFSSFANARKEDITLFKAERGEKCVFEIRLLLNEVMMTTWRFDETEMTEKR